MAYVPRSKYLAMHEVHVVSVHNCCISPAMSRWWFIACGQPRLTIYQCSFVFFHPMLQRLSRCRTYHNSCMEPCKPRLSCAPGALGPLCAKATVTGLRASPEVDRGQTLHIDSEVFLIHGTTVAFGGSRPTCVSSRGTGRHRLGVIHRKPQ